MSDASDDGGSDDSPADCDRPDNVADAAVDRWPLYRLVAESGRENALFVVVGILGTGIAQVLATADMFVIGIAFDAMFNGQPYDLPLLPTGVVPGDEPARMLAFTVALLVGLKVADVSLAITGQYCWNLLAQRIQHAVRVDAFDTVQRLGMGFFDGQQTGDVMSVLNNDVNRLEEFLTNGPQMTVYATVVTISSFGYMALLNWRLALVAVALAPVVAVANWWFGRRHERRHDAVRAETGKLNAALETAISGVPVVKAYGGERHETDRVADRSRVHRGAIWRSHVTRSRHEPALRLLAGMAFLLTFVVGTQWVLDDRFWVLRGTLTAGELIPFLYYTQNLVGPMRVLARVTGFYKGAKAAAKRVVGIQQVEPPRETDGVELTDVAGRVEYDDVSFGYPGSEPRSGSENASGEGSDPRASDEQVISDVAIDVAPGETVGLVGATGAGKSTLTKLLLRFYDPDEGAVRLDGHDVRDVSLPSLRESIGYVAQDPFLFTGTVRENIAYGVSEDDRRESSNSASGETASSDERDATDEEVVAAAKQAGAHEFISSMEAGYDTEVGERGTKLSGGQRQRIALARVLLTDPPLLVLDEATSQVDNRTEVLIQRSLAEVTADRTTLVVAHRLSTVRDADQIVVLDDGEIEEVGTHDELVAREGAYADLWKVQVGEVGAD
ncbi:ATP-binding cassette, subfamily B [Halomicrobium zhouii]|uniref:ATP-binding cassette, subfamily B n=1 Tax=Halomicrobium zhouii TaxID=767519 RepID=A0A1I6M8E1_9EURY|nr:ABC transporter ATP-binding protein [Halomicrobium zhouii]SFS11802.1 ATP-binding cassette, subfamily B [Halomicrobium zhouii]